MLNLSINQGRKSESGNVLFLILIAVALFAALSYAVTQSTRSGGGDASRETTLVNAAAITQYPASVKTAITRMIVSNSIGPTDLLFDAPPFTNLTTPQLQSQGVFYPGTTTGGGGGATYSQAPANVMADTSAPGTWYFSGENQIKDIGTYNAVTDSTNADVIAFLPGISQSACQSIHQKLGLTTTIPTEANYATLDITTTQMLQASPGIGGGGDIITGGAVLDGQPQGCFSNGVAAPGDVYVYYHVLIER